MNRLLIIYDDHDDDADGDDDDDNADEDADDDEKLERNFLMRNVKTSSSVDESTRTLRSTTVDNSA